jgi:hypothetical protein
MVRPRGLRGGVVVVYRDVAGVAFSAGGDVDPDVSESVPGVREEGAAGGGDDDRVGVLLWVDFEGLFDDIGLVEVDRYLTASTIMKLISPLVSVVPLMSSVVMGVEVVLMPSSRSMMLVEGVCWIPWAVTVTPGMGGPRRVWMVNLTFVRAGSWAFPAGSVSGLGSQKDCCGGGAGLVEVCGLGRRVVVSGGCRDRVGAVIDGERRGVCGALLAVAEGDGGVLDVCERVAVFYRDGEEVMPFEREVMLDRGSVHSDGLAESVVERGGCGYVVCAGRDVVKEIEAGAAGSGAAVAVE